MDYLQEILPKDLVILIEEYAKDRTNYDKVILQLHEEMCYVYYTCEKLRTAKLEHPILGILTIREEKREILFMQIWISHMLNPVLESEQASINELQTKSESSEEEEIENR